MTPDTFVEYFDVFKGRLPSLPPVVFREQLLAGKILLLNCLLDGGAHDSLGNGCTIVILLSPKHGLGRDYTKTAVSHDHITLLLNPPQKRRDC